VNLNQRAKYITDALTDLAGDLKVSTKTSAVGTHLIDLGVDVVGGLEAGRILAEICLSGLAHVSYTRSAGNFPFRAGTVGRTPSCSFCSTLARLQCGQRVAHTMTSSTATSTHWWSVRPFVHWPADRSPSPNRLSFWSPWPLSASQCS